MVYVLTKPTTSPNVPTIRLVNDMEVKDINMKAL